MAIGAWRSAITRARPVTISARWSLIRRTPTRSADCRRHRPHKLCKAWARSSGGSGSISLVIAQTIHQLQSRPDLIYGADFDVHQTTDQRKLANVIFVEISGDARGLLGPGDPEHSILRQ